MQTVRLCADEGEDWAVRQIVKRAATVVITPIVRMVEWLYGPKAAGIDLFMALVSAGWAGLMLARPDAFDRGSYVGMTWMADALWIGFFVLLAVLHVVGLVRPSMRNLRCGASLLSAWIWISVSASLATIELLPAVFTYAAIGMGALGGAIYLSGQPRKVG